MKKLIVLVGPPGSGKSTYRGMASIRMDNFMAEISQDELGKDGHMKAFNVAIQDGKDIIVDRMNFDKKQRKRYIKPAKEAGYEIEIVVFHVPRAVCFERIMARENHPTINGMEAKIEYGTAQDLINARIAEKERQANSALDTFFTKYERVTDDEADKVTRLGWVEHTGKTKPAVIIDLDGTMCDLTHRLHYVKNENKKLNRWDLFEKEVSKDGLYEWCRTLAKHMCSNHPVIFCSGRNEMARKDTEAWLEKHDMKPGVVYRHLFMRHRQDYRQDYIIKEVILDFEILTRYSVLFAVDDRNQVVQLWRRRGITCLQCADGDF